MAVTQRRTAWGVFARKPATVQISWLGYPWENGLPVMDFFIGDKHILPPELQPHLQSRILHLPDCFVCFDPPLESLPVNALPALATGYITFGYFGSPAKGGDEVLRLWATILTRVPHSKLLFKYSGFGEMECRERFTQKFAAFGVAPERLLFQSPSQLPELFAIMQTVDIALDPFPFTGGLMTCMALWMGLPVITWPGQSFASRQGLSFLSVIGITDTIAYSPEDYINKAVALAHDRPRLADLRKRLRPAMAASPLCNGLLAAQNLQNILRQVWDDKVISSS